MQDTARRTGLAPQAVAPQAVAPQAVQYSMGSGELVATATVVFFQLFRVRKFYSSPGTV